MWLLLKISLFLSDVWAWNIMKVLHCHRAFPVIGNNILNFVSASYISRCFTWMTVFMQNACYVWRLFQSGLCHESGKYFHWAARYSCCVPKRLVPLLCHTPAACFGVNKPCFCSSACSPAERKAELQLEVLIKAFRGDYVAGLPRCCAEEEVGKRLSLKCL